MLWILLALCILPVVALAQTKISSVRVWPGPEYTRITIESARAIEYTLFTVKDPHRVVLDLEDVDPPGALETLSGRIGTDDPFVREARVGRYKPGVVRLVLDLKTEVSPQAFALRPVGEYAYRLVLDVYPARPVDPLLALITELEQQRAATAATQPVDSVSPRGTQEPAVRAEPQDAPAQGGVKGGDLKHRTAPAKEPEVERLITIAIDAGHGGEDPGARGRMGTSREGRDAGHRAQAQGA